MAEKSGTKNAPGGKKDPKKMRTKSKDVPGDLFFLIFLSYKKGAKKYISSEVYFFSFIFFSLFWEK